MRVKNVVVKVILDPLLAPFVAGQDISEMVVKSVRTFYFDNQRLADAFVFGMSVARSDICVLTDKQIDEIEVARKRISVSTHEWPLYKKPGVERANQGLNEAFEHAQSLDSIEAGREFMLKAMNKYEGFGATDTMVREDMERRLWECHFERNLIEAERQVN